MQGRMGDRERDEPAFRSRPEGNTGVFDPRHDPVCIAETIFSPFHCLYQDALEFHTQSHLRLARSEAEASRMARAAFLLYLSSAEALVHQAACELGQPELARLICDPHRPLSLGDAWRLLPAVVAAGEPGFEDASAPPWPQFAELLSMRASWAYPGPESQRRAYYQQRADGDGSFEPLEPHEVPLGVGLTSPAIVYPRTGLPRDPYALRPRHLDTARSVLDAAIAALDRRLGGALTRRGRHRREPLRIIYPPDRVD
jgi:hypothetical protein